MTSGKSLLIALLAVTIAGAFAAPSVAQQGTQPAEMSLLQFTGRLDYSTGLGGQGRWTQAPLSIEWTIAGNADGWWSYSYLFSHRNPDTSHFILEVSEDFTLDQIRNHNWDFEDDNPRWYGAHPSNPGIPGSVFGLKFDEIDGTETLIQFESLRNPVWGDFYAKGGPNSSAWNLGFLDPDPLDPATSGSVGNKILRPNGGLVSPVPEPAGILLMGAALVGMAVVAAVRRRRS